MKDSSKNFIFWLLLGLVVSALIYTFIQNPTAGKREVEKSYSDFLELVKQKKIKEVELQERQAYGKYEDEVGATARFTTRLPPYDYKFAEDLKQNGIKVIVKPAPENTFLGSLLSWLPPLLFFLLLWFLLYRNILGAGKGAFSFGKSRAKLLTSNLPKVTFSDVAGCEEAKKELEEIIDFLKAPKKFQKLGGRIPKGVLVVGPPGTGKTLLARAVAGEAGVPFLNISGSDFVEMFVGVGASRVRDLFEQGKKNAPCIIFIDEIDAVGRQRGAGLGGGHDEREQTLNALLVEMDGFETNEGVILIAATNRPDVLDPALLRPGRFDRNVVVDNPDVKGRFGILKVHSKKIPMEIDIDLEIVARGCPGFSGADLENLMNEAALLAARKNLEMVTMVELEEAKDKVMMGPARRSLVINEKEKKVTAYHEAGHALVAEMIPGTDPLHKITIIPRGRALGVTVHLPEEEKFTYSKEYCLARIAILMGGRAAENLALHAPTNGAANDIERATELARKMVCEWGMSEKIGPVQFGKKEDHPFLGRELAYHKNHSENTHIEIDREIKKIVEEQYNRAERILIENHHLLDKIAETLLTKETIEGEEVRGIIRGEDTSLQQIIKEKADALEIPVGILKNENTLIFTIAGMMYNSLEFDMIENAKKAVYKIGAIINDKIDENGKDNKKFKYRIEVLGYTDSLGSFEEKKQITQKRADNVKTYLINNFLFDQSIIAAIAKGDQEPVGDNASLEGRATNRRVKIIFISEPIVEAAPQIAPIIDALISRK